MKNKILLGFVVLMMWGAGCRLKELDDVVPVDCPQANFSVSTQFCVPPCTIKCTDLSANAVKKEWYFDRDSISRDTHPSISFQSDGVHSIRLIAYGADGCTDDTTIYVLLSPSAGSAPLANFTVLNDSLWAGCPIQFQNTSLNYTTVQWWFGDGEYSAENTPAHTYSSAGNFPVTLRVVQNGVIDDTTIVIQVNTPPVFSRPYSLPTPFLKVGGACQLSDGSFAVYVTGGGNSDVTLNPDAYFVRVSSSSYDATTVLVEENGIVAGMLPTVDGNVMTLTELTSS